MYASDTIYGHSYSKWDTIQEDVADMYFEEMVEEDVEDEDPFVLDEDEMELAEAWEVI